MTPVLPCSISSMSLIPGASFTLAKKDCSTKYNFASKPTKHVLSSQRCVQPLSTSFRLFPHYRRGCVLHHRRRSHILSVTGTDVAVEEPNSPVLGEDSSGSKELSSNSVESSDSSSADTDPSRTPVQPKRTRPGRRSEMPPLKNEELIPGATFTGKVRSIQPFGAFVDFGAFTDGLVHVSRLSDSFVKDVGNIVSIGQEVQVRLVEANIETGRISLSMREDDDDSKVQQQKDRPASGDKPRAAKRTTSRPGKKREEVNNSKFVRGQDLEGTVKNLGRSGSFISLPEGEEGFLPTSEESDDGLGSMMGASSLQVGQEVSVRVLRFSRGKVTLTMKKGEDNENIDTEVSQGVVYTATNPFMLAFRKNKDIAVFLDEREKAEEAEKKLIESSEVPEVQEQPMSSNEVMVSVSSDVDEKLKDDVTSSKDVYIGAEDTNSDKDPEALASSSAESVDSGLKPTDEEAEESSETLDTDENLSATSQLLDKVDDDGTPDSAKTSDQALSADNATQHEVIESQADNAIAKEELQTETPSEDETTAAPVEGEDVGSILEKKL